MLLDSRFSNDKMIVADAHQYLLDHYKEFDFIWSSPPCPTHSRMNNSYRGKKDIVRYPDMSLYQEIILLKYNFTGKWVVENVESYYPALIHPQFIDRHFCWANFSIPHITTGREGNHTLNTKEAIAAHLEIELPTGTKDARKLLRNAVAPILGLHVLRAAQKETKQEALL